MLRLSTGRSFMLGCLGKRTAPCLAPATSGGHVSRASRKCPEAAAAAAAAAHELRDTATNHGRPPCDLSVTQTTKCRSCHHTTAHNYDQGNAKHHEKRISPASLPQSEFIRGVASRYSDRARFADELAGVGLAALGGSRGWDWLLLVLRVTRLGRAQLAVLAADFCIKPDIAFDALSRLHVGDMVDWTRPASLRPLLVSVVARTTWNTLARPCSRLGIARQAGNAAHSASLVIVVARTALSTLR